MVRCLLALGTNLGDRVDNLQRALRGLAATEKSHLLARSPWLETVPIGGPSGQGAFLNGAVVVETSLPPQDLVARCREIESQLGRTHEVRWDARTLDLDILLYGLEVISSNRLTVPHPRMTHRQFVLEPAAKVAGEMLHPHSKWTIEQLHRHLQSAARYVAVTAADSRLSGWIARQLCRELSGVLLEETQSGVTSSQEGHAPEEGAQEQASRLVQKSHWEEIPPLASRLPEPGVVNQFARITPVFSGFWYPAVEARHEATTGLAASSTLANNEIVVEPALVIACERTSARRGSEQGSDQFSAFIDRAGWGPVSRIPEDDPQAMLDEARAIVLSAWPELETISKSGPNSQNW